jgi:hypothetical protein
MTPQTGMGETGTRPGFQPLDARKRRLYIVGVSLYLLAGGVWLILTRRLPAMPALSLFGAFLRPRWRIRVRRIEPESGFCYVAPVPVWITSDYHGASGLELYEDDILLAQGHAPHDAIRQLGQGRYSHWGRRIYFSASDNSDPRANGRRYRLVERRW